MITYTMEHVQGVGLVPTAINGEPFHVYNFTDGMSAFQVVVPEDASKNLAKMAEGRPVIQTPPKPGIIVP